jgi:transcriptional regulator with XRE-family HTH domain
MGFATDVMTVLNDAVAKEGNAKNLALRVGLNPPTLTRWLAGKRDPTLQNLGLVMDYLGVTLSTAPASAPAQTSCPELEAECARLRKVVAEKEIRLDELRALLRPASMDPPAEKKKLG